MFKRIIAAGLTAAAISGTAVAPASAYTLTVNDGECSWVLSDKEFKYLKDLQGEAIENVSSIFRELGFEIEGADFIKELEKRHLNDSDLKNTGYISRNWAKKLLDQSGAKWPDKSYEENLFLFRLESVAEEAKMFLQSGLLSQDNQDNVARFFDGAKKYSWSELGLTGDIYRNCVSGTSVNKEFDFGSLPPVPNVVLPGGPSKSDNPSKPNIPAKPEGDVKPDDSEGSDKPDVPAKPEGDVKPGASGNGDAPAKPEGDVKPGASEGSDKPDVPGKSEDDAKPAGNGLVKDGQLTPGGIALVAGGVVAGVLALAAAVFPLILPMLPAGLQAMIAGILPF
ncbi:hypothetical protein CPHO_06870 [Corynebacterium phocae]|uniref:Uncharacterized protein n=1 Tax=Corynebacterium phocae TaxID=161895 RepID=A0A1L7D3L3_9CORY|nr:hypothetical protein [Corynebacterium phocae]APT92663.1 hypothetical protein CPHO_06870 [Corynebacterium phocae]KAA8723716.1 hypothetical protein F4V58_06395 [Corynebacterium phocae]